jgi:hypothetical protein
MARIKNWQGKFDEAITIRSWQFDIFRAEQYTYGIAKASIP